MIEVKSLQKFLPSAAWRKHFILFAKLLVFSTTVFIVVKEVNAKSIGALVQNIFSAESRSILFLWFFLLSLLNLFLDALLWKRISDVNEVVGLRRAAFHHLRSLALAIITPYNVGEFGGKYRQHTAPIPQLKAVYLTYVFRFVKMSARNFMGSLALLYLIVRGVWRFMGTGESLIVVFLAVLAVAFYFNMHRIIPLIANVPISGKKYLLPLRRILPSILTRLIWFVLGLLKFLVYPTQFLLLLMAVDVDIAFSLSLMAMILVYYSVSAFLPSLQLVDPVVKGGFGMLVLTQWGISSELILLSATGVWLFNVAIPALVGGVFFMRLRPQKRDALHGSAH